MLQIPSTIKIGAHIYKIVFRDDLDDGDFGVCRPKKLTIFIDGTAPDTQQEETFFHESLHAIFQQNGLSNYWRPEQEEKEVQILGHALYLFLKDNNLLMTQKKKLKKLKRRENRLKRKNEKTSK